MQVEDRLSRLGTHIEHSTIAIFNAAPASQLGCHQVKATNELSILNLCLFQAGNVLLRNDEQVSWGLRVDVFEGKSVRVFVNFLVGIAP